MDTVSINYVKKIKHCGWDTTEEGISIEYLEAFLKLLEESLNLELCKRGDYLNDLFNEIITKLSKTFKIIPSKGKINQVYLRALHDGSIKKNVLFESMTTVKPTRSNSGELETTTTLPGSGISCKYDCAMCPNQKGIARSYLSSEGSVVLGIIEDFDAFRQCLRRFILYEYKMGHTIDKCLHILLGGTFHSYDEQVIEDYIKKLYYCGNVYKHFSIRNGGKYVPIVQEWLKTNPFLNHFSVFDGPLFEAIKDLRPMGTLEEEKQINTYSLCGRITGIVIETRPDQISYKTMYDMRRYGITRVQLGIQHTDETVLKIMNRRHTVEATKRAIKKLRDNGFKIDGHLMPNCPGSDSTKDLKMFQSVFCGDDLQLDYCKLYICLDVPFTQIRLWKERACLLDDEEIHKINDLMVSGDFTKLREIAVSRGYAKPEDIYVWYDRAEKEYDSFISFLLEAIQLIPPWVRLNRFQRDFPEASNQNEGLGYSSTTLKTNLQQICMDSLKSKGLQSVDIRSREIRKRIFTNLRDEAKIYWRTYRANEGTEFFVSIEIPDGTSSIILGLIRVRIPDIDTRLVFKPPSHYLKVFKKHRTLRVRELHVYGTLQTCDEGNSQHRGVGKFLLRIAEYIAYFYKMEKIAIISGVGVQDYYQKRGYTDEDDYMIKMVDDIPKPIKLFGNKYTFSDFYKGVFKPQCEGNLHALYKENNFYILEYKEKPYYYSLLILLFFSIPFILVLFLV